MIRVAAIWSGCIVSAAGVLMTQEWMTQPGNAGLATGGLMRFAQAAEQAIEPNADNLPPVGRSLFDHLISNGKGGYQVPFPFERLIERIEREVQASSSGLPPVKQVLIPLGRSLQRNAGAPDFFKYPRVVAAVDGDPAHSTVMVLKDRLFLGYHEKAAIIEVVSYNEAAGRFEFQVVKDYRAGANPRVFYANRTLCTSCHQNGAPVFSRPLWDETNANPEIAARLKMNAERFHGVAVDRGVDFPNAIDEATDRANRLSLYQRVWGEGCGAGVDGDRCRAGLFLLALRYALTGQRSADVGPLEPQVMPTLVHNAQTRWPQGLPIADPDLPNRDPLRFQRAIQESNVASNSDPLEPRPPLAIWSAADEADMRQLIAGLAAFFTAADMRRLDHHLLSRSAPGQAVQRYRAPCEVRRKALGPPGHRLTFDCRGEGAALTAVVYVKGASATGAVQRMKLDDTPELRDLALQSTVENRFRVLDGGLTARRADGSAIESLTLSVSASNSVAEIKVIEDFAPVRAAVAEMAREDDALSAQPFRRAALLESLFARLGLDGSSWCCLDDVGMAPAELELAAERVANDSGARATELEGFYRYCAVCHQSRERFPPGFLGGLPAEVSAALTRCAPRIYYRLRMWERERGQRAKTPMPPAQALRAFGISTEAWRANETFAELKRYADRRLPAGLNTDSIMQRPYESLPECAQ